MPPKPIERPKTQFKVTTAARKQHTLKAQVIVHWQTGLILDANLQRVNPRF
ncbi:hypothetical protein [Psychrobacter submarinus]|uniref:hypothetical protein n=1 Tax=Psychrobacter submarinus TaxID=154108 RepID=UPI00191AC4ED|nr:hypothetical protein [Psychrobacter submarinus]